MRQLHIHINLIPRHEHFARRIFFDNAQLHPSSLRLLPCSSHFPIFYAQPCHAAEFSSIVGNQGGIVGASDGGDQCVVRADGFALGQQVGVDLPVMFGAFIIKTQALQRGEKGFEKPQVSLGSLAAPCAVKQLCLDHAA